MEKRHLNDDELRKLKSYFKLHTLIFDDDAAMLLFFELIMHTGIRTEELCRLRFSDLAIRDSRLNVNDPAKGSSKRSVYCPQGCLQRAARFAEWHGKGPDDLLTSLVASDCSPLSLKRRIRMQWQKLRFKLYGAGFDLGLHALRHSFAHRVLELTDESLMATKMAMGHKHLKTTERYLGHYDMEKTNKLLAKRRR